MPRPIDSPRLFESGFDRFSFRICCNNETGFELARFLFGDSPVHTADSAAQEYGIVCAGTKRKLSLWEQEKRLYFGDSWYELAYILMNEVLYHCIDANRTHHALHAGAVTCKGSCLVLPGESGSGKSSLTAWLTAGGCRYLTDELVFLAADGTVHPLVRPISLKGDGDFLSRFVAGGQRRQAVCSDDGAIIPHRLLNPAFAAETPRVTHFIFPRFSAGADTLLSELSPAQSCLYLMQSHVNARHFSGLGVATLAALVRKCRSYQLTYGGFDGLDQLFGPDSIMFR